MASWTAISKISIFFLHQLKQKSQPYFQQLLHSISQIHLSDEQEQSKQPSSVLHQIDKQSNFEGLEALQLMQSRGVSLQDHSLSIRQKKEQKRKIQQIQEEKKKVIEELREIDQQIYAIKGNGKNQNLYRKRQKIQRDESAQKNAEVFVKQLKNQRKQIEARKKKQIERSLLEMKKQDEQRRKRVTEEIARVKQQRREAILQRMEDEKRRRQQRKLIEMQSNQLIGKLKKQQELQKMASMVPSQIIDVEIKKKGYDRKQGFDFKQIEEHNRKYKEFKQKNMKQKRERAKSFEVPPCEKYYKNKWIQKLEEQQQKVKQEQRKIEDRKRNQLQTRMKYGELVTNIFFPKGSKNQNHASRKTKQQAKETNDCDISQTQSKPKTPQSVSSLQKPKRIAKSCKTHNSTMLNQDSLPNIKNSQKIMMRKKQQKISDFESQEKQKKRKIRELELRKQTKERLKKLQNQQAAFCVPTPQKKQYKNYLMEVKVKKDQQNDWKKIMNNEKLSQEQKYLDIIREAENLQMKAKKKQDKKKSADEDAVNLYIGSIQAKLALLQKF